MKLKPSRFKKTRISNYWTLGHNYKKEFRKQLRSIITVALGFGIAFTWREYLYESSKNFIKWLTGTSGSGAFGATLFITLSSLALIVLTSEWLKDKPKYKY